MDNTTPPRPAWHYNEFVQTGVDLDDADMVEDYDHRQGSDSEEENRLIATLGIAAGDTVVDLGCGTGSFALAAARHGARVTAIDVAANMLRYVARAADANGLTNLQTLQGGFLSWQPAAASIDVVVCRFALHHLPDFWKQIALNNIANALAPGGTLFLRDVVFSFPAAEYETHINAWIDAMPQRSGFSREEFETHVRDEYSTFDWILHGMLQRAGFTVREHNIHAPQYADYLCSRR